MLQKMDFTMLKPEIFQWFGKQSPLLSAGDKTECNTMTVSWCQMGTLWRRPTCNVFVRTSRHTHNFTEQHDYFTLSFLPESAKKVVDYCGSISGRDADKIKDCGLTVCYGAGDAPYFAEAELVLVCKKLYAHQMNEDCITDREQILPFYTEDPDGWHHMYIGQVVEAYSK